MSHCACCLLRACPAVQVLVHTPSHNYTLGQLTDLFMAIGDQQAVRAWPAIAAQSSLRFTYLANPDEFGDHHAHFGSCIVWPNAGLYVRCGDASSVRDQPVILP